MSHRTLQKGLTHTDLCLPDGRLLRYDARGKHLAIDHTLDKASWLTSNGLRVMASLDDTPRWGVLLHISASYASREPSWPEMTALKDLFFGNELGAAMILPKADDFIHGVPGWEDSHVFHLYELPEHWDLH